MPVVVASRDPARAAAVSLDVVVVAEGCLKLPRQQRTGAVQTEVLYESDWFLLFRHTHTHGCYAGIAGVGYGIRDNGGLGNLHALFC